MGFAIRLYHWAHKEDPHTEKVILSIPWPAYRAELAVKYARTTKKRWHKGEKIVKQYPYSSYNYAKNVIGGAWPEGEKTILKEFRASWYYANYVLKERWNSFDKLIEKIGSSKFVHKHGSIEYLLKYNRRYRKEKLPKVIEKEIFQKATKQTLEYVIKFYPGKRFVSLEQDLFGSNASYYFVKMERVLRYYNLLSKNDQNSFLRYVMTSIMKLEKSDDRQWWSVDTEIKRLKAFLSLISDQNSKQTCTAAG